jgi:hypothetical protein
MDTDGVDVTITSSGLTTSIDVHTCAVASPGLVHRLIRDKMSGDPALLIADEIPASSRDPLNKAGWSWFDRRGRLRLRLPGLFIDTEIVTNDDRAQRGSDPLGGVIALGIALLALANPNDPVPGVRATSRELCVSAGGVSKAMRKLTDAGLLTDQRRGAHPSLFWATAEVWSPRWHGLDTDTRTDEIDGRGVEIGTHAAISAGAPLVASADYTQRWLIDDERELRRLLRYHGETRLDQAPTMVAVAPAPVDLADANGQAHVSLIALQLAAEGGRAAEALDQWEHDLRVW